MSEKVFISYLRLPRRKPDESRSDPYYELGSYGTTTCHYRNLMHPKHAEDLKGGRIAFVQPGNEQTKLVFLSPEIHTVKTYDVINPKIGKCKSCTEVLWESSTLPLMFAKAPLICNNNGETQFPQIMEYVKKVNQPTPVSKFMSKFRCRAKALEKNQSKELIEVYENYIKSNKSDIFTKKYWETLPYPPPLIEKQREKAYNNRKLKLKLIKTLNHYS